MLDPQADDEVAFREVIKELVSKDKVQALELEERVKARLKS